MTGKEAGHTDHEAGRGAPHTGANRVVPNGAEAERVAANHDAADAETLEVAPGTEHERLEGWIPALASEEEIRVALEKAFDYRGDVTVTRKDGTKVEGYLFDRKSGATLKESVVRLFPKGVNEKVAVSYAEIAGLAFSGRDTAAGKSWEAWMKKYAAKKAAGETNIALEPEALD